ncbi:MDR/zinc-dependent alcohol dehydrogenase-like family protein [Anaeromyxobacter oryzae]|uniref:Oxidoreductase n=1 Tax=Anaeromyxobacter oryzae TaxID=2918170 RepID=A0ABM7WRJ0_9BACT|nr:zinc-binding dehydrogenase [Anaeromyxobacter oryzae]BDG02084.1 oxidoreductase [Anaeromyxobacter oryzae]
MPGAARMRAAVLAGPRRFEIVEVDRPAPGPGEVLVRLEGCGVCGSSLVPWQGREWFRYPFPPGAPGHEGWGRVAAVGQDVSGLAPGDRVALLSGAAFAEYDVAPVGRVVRVPDAIRGPFPAEALGCGANVFRRSGIRAGDQVALVGAGFIGLVALRLAVLSGARVVALSRRETALALARRYGAAETLATGADRGADVARATALAGGRLFDVVVEAVGNQASLDLSSELVREGGRLVVAGYHQDGPRTVNMWLWNWRGIDVVNAHERDPRVQREGILAAAGAVAEGRLDPEPLYTAFPLVGVGAAFQAMEERPEGFLKAVLTT